MVGRKSSGTGKRASNLMQMFSSSKDAEIILRSLVLAVELKRNFSSRSLIVRSRDFNLLRYPYIPLDT